jgi:hypothetical protein
MITDLSVFTPSITTPPLPIVDGFAASDPIQIKNIDGLGPTAATIDSTEYGSVDGEFYTGGSVGKRNIVLTVGLNPAWGNQTIEDLRQILYSYFMPKNFVTLKFTSTHMATVQIVGYIESFEPNLFAKEPEYQISIICPSPYFAAVDATTITGTTRALTSTSTFEIDYQGNVPCGFTVDVTLPSGGTVYTGEIRVASTKPATSLFSVVGTVDTTKSVEISTLPGNKYANQIPVSAGVPSNILGAVAPGSIWLQIAKGVNLFQILINRTGSTTQLNWSLVYNALYGGL